MLPKLPELAVRVLQAIENAGGYGFVVGGALRDMLEGRKPSDWDFAATLPPDRLMAAFPGARAIGGICGTLQVPFGEEMCEITPCRVESAYSDRRHPDNVRFVPNIFEDLSRRDFTVNAMAYNGEVLLDPYGGQEDLKNRLIRCVGSPSTRFSEDPLRVLRLYRFCATLGYKAEWDTLMAASEKVDLISSLSRERVRAELNYILLSDGPQVLSPLIAKGALCRFGFAFSPSLSALADVPKSLLCRWWGLTMLCGADAVTSSEMFGFSRRFQTDLAEVSRLYRSGPAKDTISLKKKLRNTLLDYASLSATFAAVSDMYADEPLLHQLIVQKKEPYRLCDLAVNGDMLLYEGIQGERCGQVLNELLMTVIRNPRLNQPMLLLGLAREMKETI